MARARAAVSRKGRKADRPAAAPQVPDDGGAHSESGNSVGNHDAAPPPLHADDAAAAAPTTAPSSSAPAERTAPSAAAAAPANPAAEFNPLRHPVLFNAPQLLSIESEWVAHVPLAYAMIDLVRPRMFVELGTHHGDSYCAFCQAVADLKTESRCFAVDTWEGDEQSGFYDPDSVLPTLRAHHDALYGGFSTLVQAEFDEAVEQVDDGTIDLLHLDGAYTYEAARHAFERWLPKMSERGVMLFHNASERHDPRYGVWRQWEVVSWRYPSFLFPHGHGLGIAAVGAEPPADLLAFLRYANENAAVVRQFFAEMGERIVDLQVLLRTTHWLATQWRVIQHWRREARQPGLPEVKIAEVFGDPEPLARRLCEEVARLAQDNLDLRQAPDAAT